MNRINHVGQYIAADRSQRSQYDQGNGRFDQYDQHWLQEVLCDHRRDLVHKLFNVLQRPYCQDDGYDRIRIGSIGYRDKAKEPDHSSRFLRAAHKRYEIGMQHDQRDAGRIIHICTEFFRCGNRDQHRHKEEGAVAHDTEQTVCITFCVQNADHGQQCEQNFDHSCADDRRNDRGHDA